MIQKYITVLADGSKIEIIFSKQLGATLKVPNKLIEILKLFRS